MIHIGMMYRLADHLEATKNTWMHQHVIYHKEWKAYSDKSLQGQAHCEENRSCKKSFSLILLKHVLYSFNMSFCSVLNLKLVMPEIHLLLSSVIRLLFGL